MSEHAVAKPKRSRYLNAERPRAVARDMLSPIAEVMLIRSWTISATIDLGMR